MTAGEHEVRIVCIVPFLNEERFLGRCLSSLAAQTRPPDSLVLVDDGSSDQSPRIAREFADTHPWVRLIHRERRPPGRDRLADAGVVRAFQWGLSHAPAAWDVAVKLDADLLLTPDVFATVVSALRERRDLGIAGVYLSVADPATGAVCRERCPPGHVRGATKFYRRACYEQIAPIPAILGWDTIDELSARRYGWQTASLSCRDGDTVQMRPTGGHDGRLSAEYRWGKCAYAIGQHPLWIMASGVRRLSAAPPVLGGAMFVGGWLSGFVERRPRAPADVRAFGRGEQLRALRRLVSPVSRQPMG